MRSDQPNSLSVRTHLKKAQEKLSARNRTHAAAEAIRKQMIP